MTDIVDVLVLLYLNPFEISQVLMIQMILDSRIVSITQLHAAQLPLSLISSTRMR